MKTSLKTALEVLDYGSNFLPEMEEIGFENMKNNTNFFKIKQVKVTIDQLENKNLKNKKDVFIQQSKDIISNKEWGSTTNIMGTGGFNNVMKIPTKDKYTLKTEGNVNDVNGSGVKLSSKNRKLNFSSEGNENIKQNTLKHSNLNTDINNGKTKIGIKTIVKNIKLPLINKKG